MYRYAEGDVAADSVTFVKKNHQAVCLFFVSCERMSLSKELAELEDGANTVRSVATDNMTKRSISTFTLQ